MWFKSAASQLCSLFVDHLLIFHFLSGNNSHNATLDSLNLSANGKQKCFYGFCLFIRVYFMIHMSP